MTEGVLVAQDGNMKTRTMALAALAALGLTGCAGNEQASHDPTPSEPQQLAANAYGLPEEDLEAVFLSITRDHLSPEGNEFMDHALVNNGHSVCPTLESNPSADVLDFEFVGLSDSDSAIVAATSVAAWCPEFEDRILG